MARECLETVGISLLIEWDVLAFLYRHGASLISAEHIGRLIGYPKRGVGNALDRLESLGLIERSRPSQGMRFYRFIPAEDAARRACIEQLMSLTESRAGRLLLIQNLRHTTRSEETRGRESLHLA
jgi:DNA-binding MarR family transcriptional regulator